VRLDVVFTMQNLYINYLFETHIQLFPSYPRQVQLDSVGRGQIIRAHTWRDRKCREHAKLVVRFIHKMEILMGSTD
jgi:hypothetical protein